MVPPEWPRSVALQLLSSPRLFWGLSPFYLFPLPVERANPVPVVASALRVCVRGVANGVQRG